jgi:hypothetical protein
MVFRVTPKAVIPVTLEDCFKPGFNVKLVDRIKDEFQRKMEDEIGIDGEDAMEFMEINMPIVRRLGLEFIIPQYRRGAVNAGLLNVELPYAKVKDLIREKGPLGELVKKGKG